MASRDSGRVGHAEVARLGDRRGTGKAGRLGVEGSNRVAAEGAAVTMGVAGAAAANHSFLNILEFLL